MAGIHPLKPPSLPQLDQDGSREKWELFEQEFDQYLVDSGLESMDDAVKCQLLRQCIGKENMHIYDSFYTLHELKTKFSNYCKRPMAADSVQKVVGNPSVQKVDGNPSEDTRQQHQQSPLKQEGIITYDRDFLLHLQFSKYSVSRPQALQNFPAIVLDKPGSSGKTEKRNRQQDPKEIINAVSISQDIKLHKAESEELDETEARTQEIYKCMQSILKFKTLSKQVQELNIDTETRLKGVTGLIYEKAVSEPAFSAACARMCRSFMQVKVPSDSEPGEKINCRIILLTKCQREFEKHEDVEIDLEARQKKINEAESEDVKKQLQEEMEIAATTARRRSIGNIRFLGELFQLKMYTKQVMHDCVSKLLQSKDEVDLECLSILLTTIGKELDTEKAKCEIDQYFQEIQEIVREKKTSSTVRVMLQDVIDLRLCNWMPRREDNNPNTIDQIHKEAAKENEQTNVLLSQNLPQCSNKQPCR
ncbi:eukaryotic translation initiation factor 4 gamma 1 isoform X2 [Patella vulgata]|uniref:eukaryotic translation initiation factor 4 gamma 1 isoform X2 n=1 Tax=Patella vulgata TaxID=6465 RepID=UPI0024A88DD7|nr:eukaryotic translation initiation factor 4 gamma 1 isoform X2 [Patella vulgata]